MPTVFEAIKDSFSTLPRDIYAGIVDEGFDEGTNLGVLNTARALFRNDVPDSKTVAELQQIWGVTPDDARAALWDARLREAELSLAGWLQTMRGMDSQQAFGHAMRALVPAVEASPNLLAFWKDPEKLADAAGLS